MNIHDLPWDLRQAVCTANWAENASSRMMADAIWSNQPAVHLSVRKSRYFNSVDEITETIISFTEKLGETVELKLVSEFNSSSRKHWNVRNYVLPSKGYCTLHVEYTRDWAYVGAVIASCCKDESNDILDMFTEILGDKDDKPSEDRLEFIVSSEGQLATRFAKRIGISLERDNYENALVSQFDRVVNEFKSEKPFASLVLLEGPPGTGKTYFLHGFAHALKGQRFIYVPPDVIGSIDQPQFISLLFREQYEHPVNLLVEDADATIIERRMDTAKILSTMLNLTDGLLGKMINVRVFATVNMMRDDTIDPAILRKGRLLERIRFDKLERQQACRIFTRLTGREECPNFNSRVTLSDIYALAHEQR